jgi:hypothetical protein
MKTSPGALVFHRDMLVDVPLIANLEAIRNNRRQHTSYRSESYPSKQDPRRIDYNYNIGDK